jgi:hypothetical protein
MHLHPGREEAPASERVRPSTHTYTSLRMLTAPSAKYIEGLENRLARMESLMRLSGVLPEDDDGSTDLATIERRLADRAGRSETPRLSVSGDRRPSVAPQSDSSTKDGTPNQPALPSPRSGTTSPEPRKRPAGEKEEDALAEMMCSLVTNNYGETRYIGKDQVLSLGSSLTVQAPHPASPSSPPRESSG